MSPCPGRFLRLAPVFVIPGLLQLQIGVADRHGGKGLEAPPRPVRVAAVILPAQLIVMIEKGIVIRRVLPLKPFIGKIVLVLTLAQDKLDKIRVEFFPQLCLLLPNLEGLVHQSPDVRLDPVVI